MQNSSKIFTLKFCCLIISLHFLSFLGVNKTETLDAFDVLVLSTGTLMALVWAEVIFIYVFETCPNIFAKGYCFLWIYCTFILVLLNLTFWISNDFNAWPHGVVLLKEKIEIIREIPILIFYIILSVSVTCCLVLFTWKKVNKKGDYKKTIFSLLAYCSFLVVLFLLNIHILNLSI